MVVPLLSGSNRPWRTAITQPATQAES